MSVEKTNTLNGRNFGGCSCVKVKTVGRNEPGYLNFPFTLDCNPTISSLLLSFALYFRISTQPFVKNVTSVPSDRLDF